MKYSVSTYHESLRNQVLFSLTVNRGNYICAFTVYSRYIAVTRKDIIKKFIRAKLYKNN